MTGPLRETLFLLAHRPSGRPRIPNFVLEAGLAAAALMELRHLGAVQVTDDGLLAVRSASPSGDPLLDRLLHQLAAGSPRAPHELLPALGGEVKDSVRERVPAPADRRDDARRAVRSGAADDLGALVWATELSGYVLGPTALLARLRLGRRSAADPLALAVRQAFPLPFRTDRIGDPSSNL